VCPAARENLAIEQFLGFKQEAVDLLKKSFAAGVRLVGQSQHEGVHASCAALCR
jgi:hypothetical protein